MNHTLTSTIDSPVGPLTLIARDGVLTNVSMHQQRHASPPPIDAVTDDAWFKDVAGQLDAYFTGALSTFDIEMNLLGTPFQERVWSLLCDIPYGQTISYGELAQRVGSPKASRAVGLANGRNPVAIIVPCHRVIGADGSLTGYGGGLERKTWLLEHELRHRSSSVNGPHGMPSTRRGGGNSCYFAGMTTDKEFIETVLDKLQPLEVTAKPMFGEYGLYHQGKNFALVCDNTLFVKITDAGAAIAGRVGQVSPYDGAKPAYRISPGKLNDRDWIISLVKTTSDALPLPKKKK